uniref:NADH-ubiquinone oxidoreductase chain 6 n=1 Tax=Hymenochirus boettgeri TaxID=247094 RepID=F6KD94_9PIPI|nr:NADH dehydrogenase subunit 6 [Hymenochirus boettgeri]ADM35681.1 NADH dehydrogenase subunit 6 [Hymenochirus boettgeri]
MVYLVSLSMVCLVLGLIAVASNPSPYYAALGLVVAAASGCWVVVGLGATFLSLVLFLIYLGGMLVVFAYSAALTAEPYPEAWGSWSVLSYVLVYVLVVGGWLAFLGGVDIDGWVGGVVVCGGVMREDWVGASYLYFLGGGMLFISGWVLLLTLFVVLELSRGHHYGGLRAL